ncbi:hypothetical protein ACFZAV_42955 [Streptomyces sp. NPDC008343]|uniref:hypothetical protein n=1 Tax=Streptomyces sp. NPDC008343 TaxID=3364828 RepID=UPI0036E4BC8F
MALVVAMLTNDEIAERRFIPPFTGKTHADPGHDQAQSPRPHPSIVIAHQAGIVQIGP